MRVSKVTFVSVGVASQELLPGAPNRVALVLLGGNAGRVTVGNDNPVALDNGLTFVQTGGPIELNYDTHGCVVANPWFAIAAVAGTVVGIIEVLEG